MGSRFPKVIHSNPIRTRQSDSSVMWKYHQVLVKETSLPLLTGWPWTCLLTLLNFPFPGYTDAWCQNSARRATRDDGGEAVLVTAATFQVPICSLTPPSPVGNFVLDFRIMHRITQCHQMWVTAPSKWSLVLFHGCPWKDPPGFPEELYQQDYNQKELLKGLLELWRPPHHSSNWPLSRAWQPEKQR